MIRRPPRSTPKPSSAASDVYKRQVHNSACWSEAQFDALPAKTPAEIWRLGRAIVEELFLSRRAFHDSPGEWKHCREDFHLPGPGHHSSPGFSLRVLLASSVVSPALGVAWARPVEIFTTGLPFTKRVLKRRGGKGTIPRLSLVPGAKFPPGSLQGGNQIVLPTSR